VLQLRRKRHKPILSWGQGRHASLEIGPSTPLTRADNEARSVDGTHVRT
jgi:hypothetical protein